MEQNRSNWYLLTGLILGLAMGLIYTWVISPITEVDTHPNLLREDYKDIYRSLISRAYQANNNLPRAEARMELIGDEDPALALAAQAQRFLAENGDNEMAIVLANLSAAIQIASGPAATPIPPTATAQEEEDLPRGPAAAPVREMTIKVLPARPGNQTARRQAHQRHPQRHRPLLSCRIHPQFAIQL